MSRKSWVELVETPFGHHKHWHGPFISISLPRLKASSHISIVTPPASELAAMMMDLQNPGVKDFGVTLDNAY